MMKTTTKDFYHMPIAIFAGIVFASFTTVANAAVAQRPSAVTTSRPTVSRGQNVTSAATGRVSATIQTATTTPQAETTPTTETQSEPETKTPEPEIIVNKSDRFDGGISNDATLSATDIAADALAEQVRRQRAALDIQSAATSAAISAAVLSGGNACDANLRACMQSKCGTDYSKCAGDTDTLWGTKMDACRRDLPCTGEEYRLFAAEIKADRDMNARISSYNAIVQCGNEYNDCILTECGTDYSKCLGKSAGDKAISNCAAIARKCTEQDSGLAARTGEVFATLRQDAEVQIQRDERRLYALRDEMRSVCSRLGAMFDERSLDCVYTVNFYADSGSTLYASKKAYAGNTFDCTQNWFGVDITTFKENAYRTTREQTAASAALVGSGVGMAAGTVTSGMLNRAMDRAKAVNAVKDAEKEYNNTQTTTVTPEKPGDTDEVTVPDPVKPATTPAPATGNKPLSGPDASVTLQEDIRNQIISNKPQEITMGNRNANNGGGE